MSATTRETVITADPALPTIEILREFDAPVDRVYRAWTERELAEKWIGPHSIDTSIEHWDLRRGGSWRYTCGRGDDQHRFFGSFHDVVPNERITQTFTYEPFPEGVSLEIASFEGLDGGRTRVRALSVLPSLEARDAMVSSGMDTGVREGYEKMDALLASL
ncbi:MAG: SRPBCC family protein [Thermoleophilia bacterium]|nr:SRPBCC family protein [Thermoleophilia bacterium]